MRPPVCGERKGTGSLGRRAGVRSERAPRTRGCCCCWERSEEAAEEEDAEETEARS
jgi:hypothetical protein